MSGVRGSPWSALLLLLGFTLSQAFYFEDGYDHHYTYSSETDLLGKKNITTVLKFAIRALNTSENGGRLHSLRVSSLVQFAPGGLYMNNPKGWNLAKTFLFLTSTHGSVTLVHVHPEDEDELVTIKKAMTSIFSVTVREDTPDATSYEETESDHLGTLTHSYHIQPTRTGRSITRSHFSHERVQRTHTKDLHYDQAGTLHTAEAYDKILVRDKYAGKDKASVVMPGEKVHNVTTSGDVPDIWTASRVLVRLDGKRAHGKQDDSAPHTGLTEDTLQIHLRVVRRRIHEVSRNISIYLQCVHDHPQQGDTNRTDCVHSLREILMSLHKEDYKSFGQSVLNTTCADRRGRCSVERLVFIDIIARIGDDVSQQLIVDHVLHTNNPDEEELRHVFIHCIAVEKPIMHILTAVEKYCFGDDDKHHGAIHMTEVQRRACLALGSLARNLHLNSNATEATRLVDKIENWIAKHEIHPDYRQKRSLHSVKDNHYITSKVILIHSLGNAGHPQYLDRIISLTIPYQGHHDWRRAAVGALRHYTCNKSAEALLVSALHDRKQSVRQAAQHLYLRHPSGTTFTREQENILLSHKYTWPVVARLKRSVLDMVLFQFKFDLPTVDWKKVVGNSAIGASFGVYFENGISGVFRPLSGFVDVSIYDKLWAEAHIGIVGFRLDILLIEVCYKGRLEYNMNKFKDFSVGLVDNIVGAFDDMAQKIMKPLTDSANKMSSQFLAADGKTTKSNFEPLANAVKGIPAKTGEALSASVQLTELVQRYQNLPWVTRLQQVVDRAQSLMEGINTDALNFYKKVSDAAIIGLPTGEKEIMDSVNRASQVMSKISQYPKQAFSQLESARLSFQLGMSRIFSSNSIIKEATSLLKGKSSSWMSVGHEIGNIVSSLKSVLNSASKTRRRRRRSTSVFDSVNDILHAEGESATEILNKIEGQATKVINHLQDIRDKEPTALQEGLDKQKMATDMAQNNFKIFQETIEKIKSTIQSLFGAKFHPAFPGQRRPSDSKCGRGTYPSGTRDMYGTAGIDLVLKSGWKVVCPVAGLVSKKSDSEVLIQPTDADFKEYVIIIANIKSSVGTEQEHHEQGDVIGTSLGGNGCEWDHIHLAVKKKTHAGGDDLCFYLDPSPFVDTLKVKPVWHQECKDFKFVHIGQIFDFEKLGENLKKLFSGLVRAAVDWMKDLAVKALQKLNIPNSLFGKIPGFINGILGKLGHLSDVAGLFKGIGNTMKNFFSAIDVKKLGFGDLERFLESNVGFKGLAPQLKGLLGKASSLLDKVPLGNLKSFATGGLGKQLVSFCLKALGGKLAAKTQLKLSMFEVCPHFKKGFPFGLDQMCSVDDDCLGFTCHFDIPLRRIKGGVTVKVKIHPEEAKVNVELNGEGKLAPKGDAVSKSGVTFGQITLSLKSSAQWKDGSLDLSLSISPCYREFCLKEITIVRNLKILHRHKRRIFGRQRKAAPDLKRMSLKRITDHLANLNVRGQKFVEQMNGMMDGVREKIAGAGKRVTRSFVKEFVSDDEFEDHQDYPNGKPLYFSFLPPELTQFTWPAGPVLFVIGLQAGAELGQDITADVQAVKSTVKTSIAPFVTGKAKVSMDISIIIASAGISLTGWIMRTKFPFILEVNYAKLPAVVTKKLLVELTPIELRLRGHVKILFVINIHFDIWHYTSPTLTGTIWKHTKYVNQNQPPRFPNCNSKKRSISGKCSVKQLAGRHSSDPAFVLEVDSQDDSSPVTLHYSIGTAPGGRNVRSMVEMKGSTLTVPTTLLPNGVPLYWTVSAKNTQGLTATTACMLPTFDNTLPDGRVDGAYPFTSHRTTIQATIVVFEDSELEPRHEVAVGYSPGEFGKEVVGWGRLLLNKTKARQTEVTDLKYFSPSVKGKLSSEPYYSTHANDDVECAKQCIANGLKCVSIDYEMHTQNCDLQQTVRGPNAKLVLAGSYFHYERLGVGYSVFVEYSDLNIEHGAQYYVNAKITNVLNYIAYLPSSGTLADFTPPEPGPIGKAVSDTVVADGCQAAVTQRCIDGNMELNHRKVIDGHGGRTVFNGNWPQKDRLATSANNFISGNCDGFHDDESGIWGYTWAVGTSVCGSDVVSFRNPHASLQSREDWTYTGLGKNLHLSDGPYFITFQAINNVVHGGALVTTVCHSQPYTVDTSPPVVHEVGDLLFDEDFDILGVYFNVSDDGSGIGRIDFGLGKTKYDVFVRSYSRHHFMTRDDPYLVVEDLGLAPGVQAWVRIRAVNSVDLFTASHGDVPILIDFTPPVKGQVLDGEKTHQDIDYQYSTNRICAQWIEFYDPESGIDSYLWGVGSARGLDDIVPFKNFTHSVKSGCSDVSLKHNSTYYSTIVALNGALNQKEIEETSDGVLIDTTEPSQGYVQDGPDLSSDIDFSSKTATIENHWANFTDPESHVPKFAVTVYVNDELKKVFKVGNDTRITDHTLSMKHLDRVRVDVTATNGAGLETTASSDGYLIDETPPYMVYLTDSETGRYQNDQSKLKLKWYFTDDESGIESYRYTIYQKKGGQKRKFWPPYKSYEVITSQKVVMDLDSLSLVNGAIYTVSVSALNNALLLTKMESSGVIIDTSPPSLKRVMIGLPGEEEDLDDDGNVLHIEGEPFHVSWTARDPESGITHTLVCVKDGVVDCSEHKHFVDYGTELSVTLTAPSILAITGFKYAVIVRVVNGAGLTAEARSRPILVEKGNSPGTVYDGRNIEQDVNYQRDMSSLSMSFSGFESDACGITDYDWGIGTEPYITDIMRFTNYGLTMLNESTGFAETSNTNFDNVKYYVTVRAKTGENCHESYIVSSSDGITVDRKPPTVLQKYQDVEITDYVIYQNQTTSLPISWSIDDESGIESLSWSVSMYPHPGVQHIANISKTLIHPGDITLVDTKSYFVITSASDKAGNEAVKISPPITIDKSPPTVKNFTCTPYISTRQTRISCFWVSMEENESKIDNITIVVRFSPDGSAISESHVSVSDQRWSFDVGEAMKSSGIPPTVYITLDVKNEADLHKRLVREIIADSTPPTKGDVTVVTTSNLPSKNRIFCQVQTTYLSVMFDGFADEESGIQRYEVGLGSKSGLTDILSFTGVTVLDRVATMKDLMLLPSTLVYITLRVVNRAELDTFHDGGAVAVSPEPFLTVSDGPGDKDMDSQHGLSVIQGRWILSDPCPVVSAEWAVEDITGEVVEDFQHTPGDGILFYNDELTLKNMRTYIVKVRLTDQLNRTIAGKSDGVTVQIQPPVPGHVRDGFGSDINYQLPTDYLAANWDPFGIEDTSQHSQQITHYEVGIGDDWRYDETRSNVHFYEDIGLNTSIVFNFLNLTAKTKIYFITVRAYSAAGSYQEAFSNGIRVGYGDEVIPGKISANPYQSSTTEIRATWTDFISDFDIREYQVAVHNSDTDFGNGSQECSSVTFEPIIPFISVGKNTIATLNHLSLNHSQMYFVIVKAQDEAGICLMASSEAITVDTTPPSKGQVFIEGGRSGGLMYAIDTTSLHINMTGFEDEESLIDHYTVQLLGGPFCSRYEGTMVQRENDILQSVDVSYPEVNFNDVSLNVNRVYYITVTAANKAGLSTSVKSPAVVMDLYPPNAGAIKLGNNWEHSPTSWSNIRELKGTVAVSLQPGLVTCEFQKELLQGNIQKVFSSGASPYVKEAVRYLNNNVNIYAKLDSSQKHFQKGRVETQLTKLTDGNYSFSLLVASGKAVSTVVTLMQNDIPNPDNILEFLKKDFIENCSKPVCDRKSKDSDDRNWNIGLLFTEEDGGEEPTILFWAKDQYKLKIHRIEADFDPRISPADYTFQVQNMSSRSRDSWDIALLVNGRFQGQHAGLDISGEMRVSVFTWNNDGYVPPINDPFNPFSTSLLLSSMRFPREQSSICRFGNLFSDSESGIKDISVGLSNTQNETANICPYRIFKSFCVPCDDVCIADCGFINSCNYKEDTKESVQHFTIGNLTLNSSTMTDVVNYTDTEPSVYYLDVKVTDHAGFTTEVKSEAIIIDTTPPVVTDVTCYDPDNSLFEPAPFVGNDHSVAASWGTHEDFSEISAVFVGIGSSCGDEDIMKPLFVDRLKKVTLNLTGTTFQDGHIYYVSVTAYSSSRLNNTSCCNFTTDFRNPVSPPSKPKALYTSSETIPDVDVGFTEYNDRVGIQWDDPVSDVEYFAWNLVSEDSNTDIYPSVRVGSKSARRVKILKGDIVVEDGALTTSVKEYLNRNFSDGLKSSDLTNGPLSLEPGKCVSQTITCVSRAHKKTHLTSRKTCVKRKKDILLKAGNRTKLIVDLAGVHRTSGRSGPESSTVSVKISRGALTIGALSPADLQMTYGAPAAVEYSPYIVNPDITSTQLSRYLFGRLIRFMDSKFYMSPVTYVHLDEDIQSTLSTTNYTISPDQEPSVIFWDSKKNLWRHINEFCGHRESKDNLNPTDFKICNEIFSSEESKIHVRSKRGTGTYGTPRFISGAVITKTILNTPPVIDTDMVHGVEDTDTLQTVNYHDAEGDTVSFVLDTPPEHGTANITAEGKLLYSPHKDFSGIDSIVLEATEAPVLGVRPHKLTKRIYLNISNVNDPPVSFFQHDMDAPIPSSQTPTHTLYLEGNLTDHELGSFWITDVDQLENLRFLHRETSNYMANFTLVQTTDMNDEQYENMTHKYSPSTISKYALSLKTSADFHGNMNFSVLAVDDGNSYSHLLTVHVFVLISPCYHGTCASTISGLPCSHPTRAETFNPYRCQCEAGYEDGLCQEEINECHQATCSLLYDCEDRLAGYECVLNIPKIIAISMCILLPVVGVGFFLWRRCKKMKSSAKIWNLPDTSPDTTLNPVFRPASRASGAEAIGSDTEPKQEPGADTLFFPPASCDPADPEPAPEGEAGGESQQATDELTDEQQEEMKSSTRSLAAGPGHAPLPHRRGPQATAGLLTPDKYLPKVVS